jgi:hypothetical protein
MSIASGKVRSATVAALAVLAMLIPASMASASTASGVTLGGDWAPFTRCPVDDPAMLAADGVNNVALCVASDSPSGSITLGSTTVPTGDSNLQFGLVENPQTGAFSIISPPGGAIVAAPVQIPGGLLGLMCPSNIPVVSAVCDEITNSSLNKVTATLEPAGDPSDFSLGAGLSAGEPILTLPVMIHLQNPLLGPGCYVGSDNDPIVLHPENLTTPVVNLGRFDANGTPDPSDGVMLSISSTGGTQGDSSFAVPGATGCGLAGVLDGAVDLKQGLPSPSGNDLVLNNASADLAGLNSPALVAPDAGQDLSSYWHSAVLP